MESIYHEAFAKLCALASYDARKRGFSIDFLESLLLRRLDKRFWTLYVECDKQLCTCLSTTGKIHFSIDSYFMDFTSSVDPYCIIKVASLSSQDLKEILKMLASHGAYIMVDPPDKEHIEAMMHDAHLKRDQLYDNAIANYKKNGKESDEYKASIEDIQIYTNEYNSLICHLHDKLKPILLDLVKTPYASLEEMLVDIDLKTCALSGQKGKYAMRLWHQKLIPYLDNKRLLGQHRECCALRGKGWGKKHSVVDYVFKHMPSHLYAYHLLVMNEMMHRNYNVDEHWYERLYRGKNMAPYHSLSESGIFINTHGNVYDEHDNAYLKECLLNLKSKGACLVNGASLEKMLIEIELNEHA